MLTGISGGDPTFRLTSSGQAAFAGELDRWRAVADEAPGFCNASLQRELTYEGESVRFQIPSAGNGSDLSPNEPVGGSDCLMETEPDGSSSVPTWGARVLNAALAECYDQPVAGDAFTTGTADALRAAQQEEGLEDDGIYGPASRNGLLWPVSSGTGAGTCVRIADSEEWNRS